MRLITQPCPAHILILPRLLELAIGGGESAALGCALVFLPLGPDIVHWYHIAWTPYRQSCLRAPRSDILSILTSVNQSWVGIVYFEMNLKEFVCIAGML